jgi:hypothetical protein
MLFVSLFRRRFGANDDVIKDVIIVLWWRSLNTFWWGCRSFWLGLDIILKPHQKVFNENHQKVGINIEKPPEIRRQAHSYHSVRPSLQETLTSIIIINVQRYTKYFLRREDRHKTSSFRSQGSSKPKPFQKLPA